MHYTRGLLTWFQIFSPPDTRFWDTSTLPSTNKNLPLLWHFFNLGRYSSSHFVGHIWTKPWKVSSTHLEPLDYMHSGSIEPKVGLWCPLQATIKDNKQDNKTSWEEGAFVNIHRACDPCCFYIILDFILDLNYIGQDKELLNFHGERRFCPTILSPNGNLVYT